MAKKTIRRSFMRFIIMYLFFSLILLGMLAPVYRYVYRMSEQNVMASSEKHLENGIVALNNLMDSMQNLVAATNADARFQTLKYESASQVLNPNLFPELRKAFSSLILPHGEIGDAGIIFTEKIILTRQRSFYSDNYYRFYEQFLLCDDLNYDEWLQLLSSNLDSFLPVKTYRTYDNGQYEALTCVMKWSSVSVQQKNILYAILPVSHILPLLADDAVVKDGYIRVFDPVGQELLNHQYESSDSFVTLTQQTRNGKLIFEIGIPQKLLHAQLAPVQTMIMTFAVILISAAIILVVLFSYSSYKPFGRIIRAVTMSKHVHETFESSLSSQSGLIKSFASDYDSLASSITTIDNRIDTYKETILRQREMIRTQTLEKALQRGIFSQEEETGFNLMFPDFPERYFLAVYYYELCAQQTSETLINTQLLFLQKIQKRLPEAIPFSMSSNMIVLIIPTKSDSNDLPVQVECLKQIRTDFMSSFSLPVAIEYSEVFADARDLAKAYRQIQMIGAFSQFSLNTWLNQQSGQHMKRVSLPLSTSSMQTIYDALCTGNLAIAESLLHESIDALSAHMNEAFVCNHTYTMLAYMIMQIKYEQPDLMADVTIPVYDADRCLDILREGILNCFQKICSIIQSAHNSVIDSYAYEVLAYIKDNMYNSNLCVNMVADHFEISAPTLQKLVKAVTNQTFSTYVEEQRLDKAYHMLTLLHSSVNDVSKSCGFFTSNSFYKAFKRKFGISPSSVAKKATTQT